jgi:hypothetical protein
MDFEDNKICRKYISTGDKRRGSNFRNKIGFSKIILGSKICTMP